MSETKSGWEGVIKGMPAEGAIAERSRVTRMEDIAAFTDMTGALGGPRGAARLSDLAPARSDAR